MAKVMIVDDEKDVLSSVARVINSMGHDTTSVTSGEEALRLLKTKKYDLVLLDLLMPQMKGDEVLQKIKTNPKIKNTKVAMMTILDKDSDDAKKVKGYVEYFQKPLEAQNLKRRLAEIL
jgi:CheY-like chemotaxis protein